MTETQAALPRVVAETQAGIDDAAQTIRAGGLVGFLTDTLYGLGADATNADAVARVFTVKGRPPDKPLLVLVGDTEAARDIGAFDERAERLAAAFWPGPLTLVLPRSADCRLVAALNPLGETVSVRVPGRAETRAFVAAAGVPITAPSANPDGAPPPHSADDVVTGLGNGVDLVLDGGTAKDSAPSTVLDLSGEAHRILRPGAVSDAEIGAILML